MSHQLRLLDLFEGKRYQKIVLIISVLVFLVLELLIFLTAASQAGDKSRIVIKDANGTRVYETSGSTLTSYEKLVFENNFGPLRDYNIHLETESFPFPFRAWLSAAVGIPVGLILMMAFLIRAYLYLLYGGEKSKSAEDEEGPSTQKNSMGSILRMSQSISIFHLGFLMVIAVLLLWMVPNFLGNFASFSIAAIREYKWFFLGAAIFLGLLISWIVYLRYKLSKQMLENQLNLEKFRVEKQLLLQNESPHLLPQPVNEMQEP